MSGDEIEVFRPYAFRVGQRMRIEGGPRAGDWEVVGLDEGHVKLRCPVTGRQVRWALFCYQAGPGQSAVRRPRGGACVHEAQAAEPVLEEADKPAGAGFPLDVDALRAVLDHLNVGVYVTDLERRIVLWNRKAQEITGHRAEDVVGRGCRDGLLNHTDKDGHGLCASHLCPLYRAMRLGKESSRPVLVYARTADGRRVACSVSVAPLRDGSGKVVGGIEVFRDETRDIEDLEFARTVQRNLLPPALPREGDVEFDVSYYPHELIGGDFYDVRALGEGLYGVLVADVRGHGVSAALYTMWLKSLEERFQDQAADPVAFLKAVNREMCRFVVSESFATASYAVVDARGSRVTCALAGHPPPLLFHAGGAGPAPFPNTGLPLGIKAEERYEASTLELAPGDMILWYTDGATDATDAAGGMLGTDGLARLASEVGAREGGLRLEGLYRTIKDRCGDISLSDDVLLLSVRRVS